MDHVETVLRRIMATGGRTSNAAFLFTWFKGSIEFENIHPLEEGLCGVSAGGIGGRRFRSSRSGDFIRDTEWN
jgi:hypothetical protein